MDADEIAEVEQRADLAALRAALGRELARLSDQQRDALRLRVVEERTYEDVARSLGVTEATARARVSRGLRALGGALELQPLRGEAGTRRRSTISVSSSSASLTTARVRGRSAVASDFASSCRRCSAWCR